MHHLVFQIHLVSFMLISLLLIHLFPHLSVHSFSSLTIHYSTCTPRLKRIFPQNLLTVDCPRPQWWRKLFNSGGPFEGRRPENRVQCGILDFSTTKWRILVDSEAKSEGAKMVPPPLMGLYVILGLEELSGVRNFGFFDLEMACFGRFWGKKWGGKNGYFWKVRGPRPPWPPCSAAPEPIAHLTGSLSAADLRHALLSSCELWLNISHSNGSFHQLNKNKCKKICILNCLIDLYLCLKI